MVYTGLQPCAPPKLPMPNVIVDFEENTGCEGAWLMEDQARKLPLGGLLEGIENGGLAKDIAVDILQEHAYGEMGAVNVQDAAHAMVLLQTLITTSAAEVRDVAADRVINAKAHEAMLYFSKILTDVLRSQKRERVPPLEAKAMLRRAGLFERDQEVSCNEYCSTLSAKTITRVLEVSTGAELKELAAAALEELELTPLLDITPSDAENIASSLATMAIGDGLGVEECSSGLAKLLSTMKCWAEVDISTIKGRNIAQVARTYLLHDKGGADVSSEIAEIALKMQPTAFDLSSIVTLIETLRGDFTRKNEMYVRMSSHVLGMVELQLELEDGNQAATDGDCGTCQYTAVDGVVQPLASIERRVAHQVAPRGVTSPGGAPASTSDTLSPLSRLFLPPSALKSSLVSISEGQSQTSPTRGLKIVPNAACQKGRVQASQVGRALSSFASVGCLTLAIATRFLHILNDCCHECNGGGHNIEGGARARDIIAALVPLVESSREGRFGDAESAEELLPLISQALQGLAAGLGGCGRDSACDLLLVGTLIREAESGGCESSGGNSCRITLRELLKARAQDRSIAVEEAMCVVNGMQELGLLTPDKDDEVWLREMLECVDPQGATAEDADGMLEAFARLGCRRGPLMTFAFSQLQAAPHSVPLARLVKCLHILNEADAQSRKNVSADAIAQSVSFQLSFTTLSVQDVLVIVTFFSRMVEGRVGKAQDFTGPGTAGMMEGQDRDGGREVLAALSLVVEGFCKTSREDAEALALAFGSCRYWDAEGRLARTLARYIGTADDADGWQRFDVSKACRVISCLFQIGLEWNDARGDAGSWLAEMLATSLIVHARNKLKLAQDEACVAIWYMGLLGGGATTRKSLKIATRLLEGNLCGLGTRQVSIALQGLACMCSDHYDLVTRLMRRAAMLEGAEWEADDIGRMCYASAVFVAVEEGGRLGNCNSFVPRGIHSWIVRVASRLKYPLKGDNAACAYLHFLVLRANLLKEEVRGKDVSGGKGWCGDQEGNHVADEWKGEPLRKESANGIQIHEISSELEGKGMREGKGTLEVGMKWGSDELARLRNEFEASALRSGRGKPEGMREGIANALRIMGHDVCENYQDADTGLVLDVCFGKKGGKFCVEIEGPLQRIRHCTEGGPGKVDQGVKGRRLTGQSAGGKEYLGEVAARRYILTGCGWAVYSIDAREWKAAGGTWEERALLRGVAPLVQWATLDDEVLLLSMATDTAADHDVGEGVGDAVWSAAVFRWRDPKLHEWAHELVRAGNWKGSKWQTEAALRYIVSCHFDSEMMGELGIHCQCCRDVVLAFANLVRCCTLQGTQEASAESMPTIFQQAKVRNTLESICPQLSAFFRRDFHTKAAPTIDQPHDGASDADAAQIQDMAAESNTRSSVGFLESLRGEEAHSLVATLAKKLNLAFPPDTPLRFSAYHRVMDSLQTALEPVLGKASAMHVVRWASMGGVPYAYQQLAEIVSRERRGRGGHGFLAREVAGVLSSMRIRCGDPEVVGEVCSQTGWEVDVGVNTGDATLWEPYLKRCDANADGYLSRKEFSRAAEGTVLEQEGRWEGAWAVVSSSRSTGLAAGDVMPDAERILGRGWEGHPCPLVKDGSVCCGCGVEGHEAWECPKLFFQRTGLCMPGMTPDGFRQDSTLARSGMLSPEILEEWVQMRAKGWFRALPGSGYARVQDLAAFLSTPFAVLTDPYPRGVENKQLAEDELRRRQLQMAGWQVRVITWDAWDAAERRGAGGRSEFLKGLLRVKYDVLIMRADDA